MFVTRRDIDIVDAADTQTESHLREFIIDDERRRMLRI